LKIVEENHVVQKDDPDRACLDMPILQGRTAYGNIVDVADGSQDLLACRFRHAAGAIVQDVGYGLG